MERVELTSVEVMAAVEKAAAAAMGMNVYLNTGVVKAVPACGCGRAYATLSSKLTKKEVNAVARACKKTGLVFLRKAYGVHGPTIYIGYDNADGRALTRAKVVAEVLTANGLPTYEDAVAD